MVKGWRITVRLRRKKRKNWWNFVQKLCVHTLFVCDKPGPTAGRNSTHFFQRVSQDTITKRVHYKFSCITINFDRTQLGVYMIQNFILSIIYNYNCYSWECQTLYTLCYFFTHFSVILTLCYLLLILSGGKHSNMSSTCLTIMWRT